MRAICKAVAVQRFEEGNEHSPTPTDHFVNTRRRRRKYIKSMLDSIILVIIVSMLVNLMLPSKAGATKFAELRYKIQLPPQSEGYNGGHFRIYHYLVPQGYFVLNKNYNQLFSNSFAIVDVPQWEWVATISYTGSTGVIDVTHTKRAKYLSESVGSSYEYSIYKVTDSGTIELMVQGPIYINRTGWGGGPITHSTRFNVAKFGPGLYLLHIMGTHLTYNWIEESHHAYIPFEIIDSDLFFDPPVYFASPGDNLSMTAIFDNDDSSSTITASLIPSPENPTELPLTVKKISETKYEILYSVPGDAAKNTINLVHARAYYGGKEVLSRRYAVIIIGNESAVPTPLDLSTVCPFILNPLWAITEQAVLVGCYDNPMDSYTVSGGKVWIPNGSTAVLTNQGNGTITASLRAPSTEGFVPVLYEVDVQDTSGRRFKVSGSQNMIVTSSPDTMYCPPPADGVVSMPGGEQGVRVRLFR